MAEINWQDADGTVTAVERLDTRGGPVFTTSFNYKVGEHWYGGYFSTQEEYAVGDSIAVRYNPDNPDENDLVDGRKRQNAIGWIIVSLLIAFFLLLGIFGHKR